MYDDNHDSNPLVRCGGGCRNFFDVSEMADHYVECISRRIKQRNALRKKPKQCTECGKMCNDRKALDLHAESHIKERNFHCDKCPKRFKTDRTLQKHIRKMHEGIFVPQTCTTCGAVFRAKITLVKHEYEAHSIGELKLCTLCGFSCVTDAKLHRHMKTYHEDPKLQCSYCPKIFRWPKELLRHERMHRGEKPFSCSMCSSSFALLPDLRQHEKGVHKIAGPKGGRVGWYRKNKRPGQTGNVPQHW